MHLQLVTFFTSHVIGGTSTRQGMAANLAPAIAGNRGDLTQCKSGAQRWVAPAPSTPAPTGRKCHSSAEPPRHSLEAFRFDYLRQTNTLSLRIVIEDRKSTRLNSSHRCISYAV